VTSSDWDKYKRFWDGTGPTAEATARWERECKFGSERELGDQMVESLMSDLYYAGKVGWAAAEFNLEKAGLNRGAIITGAASRRIDEARRARVGRSGGAIRQCPLTTQGIDDADRCTHEPTHDQGAIPTHDQRAIQKRWARSFDHRRDRLQRLAAALGIGVSAPSQWPQAVQDGRDSG
jgi:hypothetical protein